MARVVAVSLEADKEQGEGQRDPQKWEIEVPGRGTLDLDPARSWTLSVRCPRTWAPEVSLEPGRSEEAIRLTLLPVGRLGGRWDGPHGPVEADADEMKLRLQPAESDNGLGWRTAEFRCPLDRGRFDCEVPAVRLDVRLAVPGFAPRYVWDLEVPAGESVDLGALELVEGASISGWVVDPRARGGTAGEGAPVTVSVAPQIQGTPSPGERRRLDVRGEETVVDGRGFFQLAGLAAGSYELTASLPGFSPARRAPLTLSRAEELAIERPIHLEPLAALDAYLDPPHGVDGRAWRVRLLGEGRGVAGAVVRKEVASGAATPAGFWGREGLPAGSYLLRVEDEEGSIWTEIPVELDASLGPLNIELPAVAVEGEVLLAQEPVVAEVIFGTTYRVPSLRIATDPEGRFQGVLPHEGEWPVEIALEDRPPQALDPVEVKRGRGGVARLTLHLPDTRLAGEVVDLQGEAVGGAHVLVVREDARASRPELEAGIEHRRRREADLVTDRGGRFEIEGLLPATLFVLAHDRARSSDWHRVELAEDAPAAPVRLVLHERTRITGVIVSPEGPVPGAAVVGFARGGVSPISLFARGVTGADGSFSIEVSAGTELLDLLVAPPGDDVVLRRVTVGVEPLRIAVDRTGSRLVLSGAGTGTLVHGGAEVPLRSLMSALFPIGRLEPEGDGRLALVGLEPGAYAFCTDRAAGGCPSGVLAGGGELVLHGPEAESGEEER